MGRLRSATSASEVFGLPDDGDVADPYTVAVRAFVWGFPLVQMAWIRLRTTNPDDPFAPRSPATTGAPINRWGHQIVPADPSFRSGVGPSVDLLYSSIRLDLDAGPYVIEAPDCGDRYYTLQVAHADSAADVSYGRRTHGAQLPPLVVLGPGHDDAVPAGAIEVRCPTRYCLSPARFLFDPADPTDIDRVRALQLGLRVRTLEAFRRGADDLPPVTPQRSIAGDGGEFEFLSQLGAVLRDWVVRPEEQRLVRELAAIGITPERGFEPGVTAGVAAEVVDGLADGAAIVRRASEALGTQSGGWTVNWRGPRFGDDWLLRAAVAKDQIVVTVPEEAVYPIARVDSGGEPLDGAHRYRIRFAADDLPDVEAFWSITLYDDDGFLVENPIGRHAVSERTPGIVRTADGGLEVEISRHEPVDDEYTNWLPAPDGPCYLMARLYVPSATLLAQRWTLPPVERLADR